ncbi:MAG: hypothetical protein ABI623_05230 [bacterium]
MCSLDETNLRWLAAAEGLPEDDTSWSEKQMERWVRIVHDYEDRLGLERLKQ